MSKKLYVGNLSFQATDDQIRECFSPYGEIAEVTIVKDNYTGRSRGFAFVEMASDEDATKAREALNGKPFMERDLTIDWARPKASRDEGGSGSRPPRGGGRSSQNRW